MHIAEKIDQHGKAAWIGLMVVSFILFWPIGLGLLAFLIWSGRMGCNKSAKFGSWWQPENSRRRYYQGRSSGNSAFDDYREETLRRLEEEQKEFEGFLERLRKAKDKQEFDQFMAERRRQDDTPDSPMGSTGPVSV